MCSPGWGSVGWVPDFEAVADFIPGRNNTCVLEITEKGT